MHPESLTVIEFDTHSRTFEKVVIDNIPTQWEGVDKIYWFHVDLNDRKAYYAIAKKLNLASSVKTLCDDRHVIPTSIDTDESLTFKIHTLNKLKIHKAKDVPYSGLVIHLTAHYCLTASFGENIAINKFQEEYPKAAKFAQTPCFVLFLILDIVINNYGKGLFNVELEEEKLDRQILLEKDTMFNEVITMKTKVMKLRRNALALRELLMRISGRHMVVISEACRMSLRNLMDHIQMIINEGDSALDVLNGFLARIDNELMQKMNHTMKILSSFAALFLPLTLVTGIYGMNFRWMPELEWKYGYFVVLGFLVVCSIGLIWYFKKKDWV